MNGRLLTPVALIVAALALATTTYLAANGGAGPVPSIALLAAGLAALVAAGWTARANAARAGREEASTIARLERTVAVLEELSVRDPLTGLYNRRALFERLEEEIARCRRHGGTLAIAMFDIDHFKTINDSHGHATGDAVLFAFAAHLKDHSRSTDLVARYGGEEFVLVLPHTGAVGAQTIAQRVLTSVECKPVALPRDLTIPFSLSAGVACYPSDGTDGDLLMNAADQALYAAKRAGRNRVAIAEGAKHARVAD